MQYRLCLYYLLLLFLYQLAWHVTVMSTREIDLVQSASALVVHTRLQSCRVRSVDPSLRLLVPYNDAYQTIYRSKALMMIRNFLRETAYQRNRESTHLSFYRARRKVTSVRVYFRPKQQIQIANTSIYGCLGSLGAAYVASRWMSTTSRLPGQDYDGILTLVCSFVNWWLLNQPYQYITLLTTTVPVEDSISILFIYRLTGLSRDCNTLEQRLSWRARTYPPIPIAGFVPVQPFLFSAATLGTLYLVPLSTR